MEKPKFTLIAGINGAGKSTAYEFMGAEEKHDLGVRINPDELTMQYGSAVVGGREAVKLRDKCLEDNISFHQETTFTGKSILKLVDKVKDKDYTLNLIYVSVDSAETAIKRVANRVKNGGHDIPTDTIIKRYPESLNNLKENIHKFDNVRLFDNTEAFSMVFSTVDGKVAFISDTLPKWAEMAVANYQEYLCSAEKKNIETETEETAVSIKRNVGGTFSLEIGEDVFTYSINDIENTTSRLKKDFDGISDDDITAILDEARSQTAFDNQAETNSIMNTQKIDNTLNQTNTEDMPTFGGHRK